MERWKGSCGGFRDLQIRAVETAKSIHQSVISVSLLAEAR